MRVEKIKLKNFRNYEFLEIGGFSGEINIITGKNAQGKTNFIEAVNYFSTGKSFRDFSDIRLIKHGESAAYLGMEYKDRIPSKIEAAIFGEGKKSIKINGMSIKKLSELFGSFYTVVFSPEDINTVKESPGLRRRFLDIEISKIYPAYYSDLQKYNEALKAKNKLLKEKTINNSLIEAYNIQLARYASDIIKKRYIFINNINKTSSEIHYGIANENINILYKASAEPENTEEILLNKYQKLMEREKFTGITLAGPHREDFEIFVNGKSIKIYGSQGQQRTAMLSVKLAAANIIKSSTGKSPVILLDDVFSELDEFRQKSILKAVSDSQVFITAADIKGLKTENYAVFEAENGIILKK